MSGFFPKKNPPISTKKINIGFILLNKDKMTIEQMAYELDVSIGTISRIIKEYKIDYKKKDPFFTKYNKIEQIKHF